MGHEPPTTLIPSVKPYYASEGLVLYHGDCRELLPLIPDGLINLVVADPPYTTGISSFGEDSKSSGWGDIMNSAQFNACWLQECRRVTTARQGAVWVFNSWRSMPILARASYEIAWAIVSLLIWDKEWIGPGGMRGLRPSYEQVALFAHEDFAIKDRGLPDIWRHKWSSQKPHGHPAEKPVSLIARMITESGGHRVLDPFCGSGSTLEAARLSGVSAFGIEIEERWCEVAMKRLQQGHLPYGEGPIVE